MTPEVTIDPYYNSRDIYKEKKYFVGVAAKFLFTALPNSKTDIFTERNHLHLDVKKALEELGVTKVFYKKVFGKWVFDSGKKAHFCHVCSLIFDDEACFEGAAYCSVKDSISKRSGKLLSLKRALGAYFYAENSLKASNLMAENVKEEVEEKRG
jgi:hypothetical protein